MYSWANTTRGKFFLWPAALSKIGLSKNKQTTLHCISEAISLSIAKSKQTAEKTADYNNDSNFSYLTALHCSSEAIFQCLAKNKQTAESKHTADYIKNVIFHT